MLRLFMGPLMEEAGAEAGAAPAEAAPAEAPKASQAVLDRIAAKRAPQAAEAPAEEGEEAPEEAEPGETEPEEPAGEKKKLPKPIKRRPTSLAERIKVRRAAEEAAREVEAEKTQVSAELEKMREQLDMTRSESARFRKAMADEDYNGALKALGVEGGVEEFTRKIVEKKTGAKLPEKDPRVDELEAELKKLRTKEEQREAERAQREAERAHMEELESLKAEAEASEFEEISKAAGISGFTPLTYNLIHQHAAQLEKGDLTMDDIWAMTHSNYQTLFDEMYLSGAFEVPGRTSQSESPPDRARVQREKTPDRSGVKSAQPARKPTSHISPASASEPVAQREVSPDKFQSDWDRRRASARRKILG